MTTVKLNELETMLDGYDYPLTREALIEARGDVPIVLAEGKEPLGASWRRPARTVSRRSTR
jgi:hypothetical protein